MNARRPNLHEAKSLARNLRAQLAKDGAQISHGRSLELVSRQHGFKDWNSFSAAINAMTATRGWAPGDRLRGRYLGQPFEGAVRAAEKIRPGWFRLTIDFDAPVDVVAFESFSAYRSRVRGLVGPDGATRERTSDNRPHLQIHM